MTRVAVVTGGTRGIGAAISAQLKRKAERQIAPYDPEDDDNIDGPLHESPTYKNDRHSQPSTTSQTPASSSSNALQ